MTKTNGHQQFEHLSDKSSLFLLMLKKESETLDELRDQVAELRGQKDAIQESTLDLKTRISDLQTKRDAIDEKAGVLLKFLDDIPFS